MRSSRDRNRIRRQHGFGLVEALVGVALLGVAMVVLLGSLSSLLVGARIAERRTVEQRIARNEIEALLAKPFPSSSDCSPVPQQPPPPIDGVQYAVSIQTCLLKPGLVEFTVTVSDPSGAAISLSVDRAAAQFPERGD